MKHISTIFILSFIPAFTFTQTPQMARDAETIQSRMADLSKTWNDHDSKKFSMLLSEDADFTNSSGESVNGRNAIELIQAKYFSFSNKLSRLKIISKKIRYITNDITSVDARWETEKTGSSGTNRGLFVCIMTRNREDWVIAVMHIMTLSPN